MRAGQRQQRKIADMENSRPTRRPRRMREPRHLGMPLLGSPPLRNHLKPIEILSQDQLTAIQEASLRLLEETGIEFMGVLGIDRIGLHAAIDHFAVPLLAQLALENHPLHLHSPDFARHLA